MGNVISFPVREPRWNVWYEGEEIGGRITPMLISIRYTDHVGGQSNDLGSSIGRRRSRAVKGDLKGL